jgi:hypothetical protein
VTPFALQTDINALDSKLNEQNIKMLDEIFNPLSSRPRDLEDMFLADYDYTLPLF